MEFTILTFTLTTIIFGITESSFVAEHDNLYNRAFFGSFSSPLYHQFRYGFPRVAHSSASTSFISYTPKPIPAQLPVAKPFDIEIMKPMSQLPDKKTVPLYVIPQNALHVFTNSQKHSGAHKFQTSKTAHFETLILENPSHIPAIEIPLDHPMTVGSVSSHVLAPSGFNVLLDDLHLEVPVLTAALLAPVPVGTIVSQETPVILTTIYAVPSLPSPLPTFYPILAQFPSKMIGPSTGSKLDQSVKQTFVTVDNRGKPGHRLPETSTSIPISPGIVITYPSEEVYPVNTKFPSSGPPQPSYQQEIRDDNDLNSVAISSSTGSDFEFTPRPFINSKESPYLRELREQSIRAKVAELQKELETLIAIRKLAE